MTRAPKSADVEELKSPIRTAVPAPRGDHSPEPEEGSTAASAPGLTPRQYEVLQLLAEGHSMKEVAARLDVTPRTIAFHKYRMMAQLHVKTTAELVRFAVRHGVLAR